jgi:hypothetical protein
MKLPIATLITLLENEMTEEKCDALALALSSFVSSKGGVVGKLAGGIVYGAIDAATPGPLFAALHKLFPDGHEVEVPEQPAVND